MSQYSLFQSVTQTDSAKLSLLTNPKCLKGWDNKKSFLSNNSPYSVSPEVIEHVEQPNNLLKRFY